MTTDRTKIYINGSWVEPLGGGVIDVINPATEQLVGQVSAATPADVDRAVKAALPGLHELFPHDAGAEARPAFGYLECVCQAPARSRRCNDRRTGRAEELCSRFDRRGRLKSPPNYYRHAEGIRL